MYTRFFFNWLRNKNGEFHKLLCPYFLQYSIMGDEPIAPTRKLSNSVYSRK